ncbi:MAG: cobalamin-dependent protein, partial [Pseudomonadota bacterium]|nr:cobalamin-dependent protein [Pseudomonadota bacterium]
MLITKIGLDGHDRGSRLVAAFLRDAGFEVIYTPPWQSIDAVVDLSLQEDVDVIGISDGDSAASGNCERTCAIAVGVGVARDDRDSGRGSLSDGRGHD